MIEIKLFGKFEIIDNTGAPINIPGAKTQGLLAYLALNMGMPPSRDRLMALFWGDRFTDQARQSLRQAIAKLKKLLNHGGTEYLFAQHDRVGLNPDYVKVDIDDFARLVSQDGDENVLEAVSLLNGNILEGFHGQQAEFEDWLSSERQRLTSLSLNALERAASIKLKSGQSDQATQFAQTMIALDPLRDGSHAMLIRILAQRGERAAAIQQFNNFQSLIQKELGVGAGPDLLKLIAEVKGDTFFLQEQDQASQPQPDKDTNQPLMLEPTGRTSIAVIPFATLSTEGDLEQLVEGITDDLSANLSRFSWLEVHASISKQQTRLTSEQMSNLGSELGLNYVVHGYLRAYGDKIRLTAQLAEPSSGRYVWVQRYDRSGNNLLTVQDDLVDTLTGSIEAELERLAGRRTRQMSLEEMDAWDCYHRGLAIQYEFDAATNLSAQKHFRRAIELDPNFALAFARLSYAIVISAIYFEAPNIQELLDEALQLAQTAARLEPDDAVIRFALGRVHLARGEYDRSIADLKAAIDLNPGLAQAHCGLGDSMAYSGQLDGAMDCFDQAVRISPSDPYRWAFLSYGATALLFKGAYQEAAEWALEAASVPNAHYWPTAIRASALAHADDLAGAKQELQRLEQMRPGINCAFVRERLFYLKDPTQIDIYVQGLQKAGLP